MREVLSDPWAFWMGHKHSSSVQTTKGAELGCLWLKTSCAALAGRDKTIQAASTARISPVARQCFGEAQCSFTPIPQPQMLSGLCPNHSKEQTQLHSTFPIDNLCSGKHQWKEAHPLAYGYFSVWTWTVLHGGQNSMGRTTLETMHFLLLHEVATIGTEKWTVAVQVRGKSERPTERIQKIWHITCYTVRNPSNLV